MRPCQQSPRHRVDLFPIGLGQFAVKWTCPVLFIRDVESCAYGVLEYLRPSHDRLGGIYPVEPNACLVVGWCGRIPIAQRLVKKRVHQTNVVADFIVSFVSVCRHVVFDSLLVQEIRKE